MSKKLIQSDGTEFEQNGKDMAIIDTRSRGGIPIMINADEFNEAYANADSETKSMIHAGGGGEEVDPVFTASPAYGIQDTDITNWNGKLSSETDPIFSASPAAGISNNDIESWNGKSDFSGNYDDLTNKPLLVKTAEFPSSDAVNLASLDLNCMYINVLTSGSASSGPKFNVDGSYSDYTASSVKNAHLFAVQRVADYGDIDTGEPYAIAYILQNDAKSLKGYKLTLKKNTGSTGLNISSSMGPLWSFAESDPVFSSSPAAGITSSDISNWNAATPLAGLKDGSASGSLRGANTIQEEDDPSDPDYYVMGSNAMAIGTSTKATGNSAIAAGPGGATASGTGAVAIGYGASASGSGAFALGSSANASGSESFALGTGATASGSSSLALGSGATANGTGGTMVVGSSSSTSANSFSSVALGLSNNVTGTAQGCAAIGYGASATGYGCTAFNQSSASGSYAHSEGTSTASGNYSHAEGQSCTANGTNAHAEGSNTEAGTMQHAEGMYNLVENLPIIHMVGNGNSDNARSNAYTLDQMGNGWFSGDVYVGSTSGTHKDSGSVKLLHSDVIAPEYDSTSTYTLGAYVMHDNKLYECTTAITQAENWTAAHWTQRTLADLLGTIRSSLANI